MDQVIYAVFSCSALWLLIVPFRSPEHAASPIMSKLSAWLFTSSLLSSVQKRIDAWLFLLRGPDMIQADYEEVSQPKLALSLSTWPLLRHFSPKEPLFGYRPLRIAISWYRRGTILRRSMLLRRMFFLSKQLPKRFYSHGTPCRTSTGLTKRG